MQWIITILLLIPFTAGVKHELFKTCNQAPYCRHNRVFADRVAENPEGWVSPYTVSTESIVYKDGQLSGSIFKSVEGLDQPVEFPFKVIFIKSGGVRLTIDEKRRQDGDIELPQDAKIQKGRYNETEKWAFLPGAIQLDDQVELKTHNKDEWRFIYKGDVELVIKSDPFEIHTLKNGATQVVLNQRGLLNIEEWRQRPGENETDLHSNAGEDEALLFGDSFSGKKDSKPRGPESIALDVEFHGYNHVYGIPEHADRLDLRDTNGQEPYRLFNVDIFEYEVNSPMSMYGSIPFMQSAKPDGSCGVLWLNSADTWIDINKKDGNTNTHWMSESGILDVFIFVGDKPQDIFNQHGKLFGFTRLPLLSSIGYHQCRWNYNSQDDVLDVNSNFDKSLIPYDMIWLDIEYLDDKKYFTWNPSTFPNPQDMVDQLDLSKRKLVAIIDPHIKKADNYPVYSEMVENNLATLNKDSNIFEGQCWPATSIWIDSFSPKAIEYWKSLHENGKFVGNAKNIYIWNDMNEPSVFDGPEGVFPRDNIHYNGWEHRDVHNVNGHTLLEATYEALLSRFGGNERPFILSRSYFTGTSRLAAVWTGDNQAKWEYLSISIPMILSSGIAGQTFNGADVGGFFGDPSNELLTRWYQLGVFYPFFRAHAHIDSKRREPYLIDEPYQSIIANSIRLRYQLLPIIYTSFYTSSINGLPVLRPLYVSNPENIDSYEIDDEFFLGDSGLLIHPVTTPDTNYVNIYLPDSLNYFDYYDYSIIGNGKPGYVNISSPLEKIPILVKESSIITRRDRNRRSSELSRFDPITLIVFVDDGGNASGNVYFDDGKTFNNDSIYLSMQYNNGILKSTVDVRHKNGGDFISEIDRMGVRVEKVIIVNSKISLPLKNGKALQGGKSWKLQIQKGAEKDTIIIRDPKVKIAHNWELSLY